MYFFWLIFPPGDFTRLFKSFISSNQATSFPCCVISCDSALKVFSRPAALLWAFEEKWQTLLHIPTSSHGTLIYDVSLNACICQYFFKVEFHWAFFQLIFFHCFPYCYALATNYYFFSKSMEGKICQKNYVVLGLSFKSHL